MTEQKNKIENELTHKDDIDIYLQGDKFDREFAGKNTLFDGQEIEFVGVTLFLKGVKFDNLHDYLAIRKADREYNIEEFKKDLCMEIEFEGRIIPNPMAPPIETIEKMWENVQPYTAKEIFSKFANNAEQRMVAISFLDPEEIHKSMDATLVDKQVIKKAQRKTRFRDRGIDEHNLKPEDIQGKDYEDLMEEEIINREESYKLYKIPKESFNKDLPDDSNGIVEDDVMYLQVVCPSTDRKYFIYVDSTDERCNKNALEAIAWTFRDESGNRLTPEQYLTLEQES